MELIEKEWNLDDDRSDSAVCGDKLEGGDGWSLGFMSERSFKHSLLFYRCLMILICEPAPAEEP